MALTLVHKYSPDQPRDPDGRFGGGGGGATSLNDAQAEALRDYQGFDFVSVNGDLRSGGTSDARTAGIISNLSSAIAAQPPLAEPMTVYRQWSTSSPASQQLLSSLAEGGVIHDAAFTSTTTDPEVAAVMSSPDVTMKITLPSGSRVLDVDAARGLGRTQSEILLDKGSSIRIDSMERTGNGAKITGTYLP